jgi:hypothetical protein
VTQRICEAKRLNNITIPKIKNRALKIIEGISDVDFGNIHYAFDKSEGGITIIGR